ncbi:MAG TPA: type I DNA topoisomerase [Verrucomicrobiae bacterium]|nr:type I DNA topoisomerase [Verrucomicrobiae bacterium]
MSNKHLVIVESPAKAKTIEKFLGKDFQVKSSFGHIRDLPKKGMSVDIANNFTPAYEVSPDKKKTVSELKKLAKQATQVWLASDEDREGEAIAWHLSEVLGLDPKTTKRIVFHEITKPAITAAIEKPRTIDIELVNAQQARRILDRIVGYELSPVLWKKVRPGLSAGRVQSVAVRLIVEREREITAHQAVATFKLTAVFNLSDGTELTAEAPTRFSTKDAARKVLEAFLKSDFSVANVKQTPGSRSPSAPFTTSTLQQEASRKLGYSPKQTMMLAQRLYEAGHITYMRTDSVNLSKLALSDMASYIKSNFGDNYHHSRNFATKSAGAQEAHEAIRPTRTATTNAGDDSQQQKLYQLIWKRTVASQMTPAELEKTTITIAASAATEQLEAKGEVVLFDGFLKVYEDTGKKDAPLLPPVKVGDPLNLQQAQALETLSRAPARYTEASLVRKLEEIGIGRPSTYAPTISTIQDRGYVIKGDIEGEEAQLSKLIIENGQLSETTEPTRVGADRGKLLPTDTGNVVTDFLVKYFPSIVDYDFTKDVEAEFDNIAEGKKDWRKMLKEFYEPFHKTVDESADISRAEATQSRTIGTDPKSGKPVSARYGRFGPMVQIGSVEDEEKPKFAGIPDGLSVETITLEQALQLFSLPRVVGKTDDGQEILANTGRFGPYLKVGSTNLSIRGHDPFTIELTTARELIVEDAKKKAERFINEFEGGIQVLNGRYGPYITDGKKNAKIPKGTDPKSITLEQAKDLLEKAPAKKGFRRRGFKK